MVNLAIIGVGRWGRILVDSVQGKSDTVRFSHAVTRTLAKAEDYCREKGIVLSDSFDDILADPNIDGIALATPHSQHADQIVAAASAGKHIFCEKPVTLTRASAEAAMAAVRAAGIVFAAGHNRRFLPAVQMLKSMVAENQLGTILHIEGNMSGHVGARYTSDMWRVDPVESPAGGLAGSGIHVIDTMIHLLGPISEVQAQSYRLVHEIEMDDTTSMLFRFSSGATGYLTAMTATAPIFRVQVFGDKGSAELRGEDTLEFTPVEGVRVTRNFPACSTELAQFEAFARAITGKAPFPISLEDVIAGIAAFEAVPVSAANHERITL